MSTINGTYTVGTRDLDITWEGFPGEKASAWSDGSNAEIFLESVRDMDGQDVTVDRTLETQIECVLLLEMEEMEAEARDAVAIDRAELALRF